MNDAPEEIHFLEELDKQTQLAIEEALRQSSRGEGRPWEDVRREISAQFHVTDPPRAAS